MPLVIVVEHPRYAGVYSSVRRGQEHDDRFTLFSGEGWAATVDELADGAATPQHLAEHSTSRRRPLAHLGNRVTHCVIPLPQAWQGTVPNGFRPGLRGRPNPGQGLRESVDNHIGQVQSEIVQRTIDTVQRAALWSRPRGVVSLLVGHGSTSKAVDAQGHVVGVSMVALAPAQAAEADNINLQEIATVVQEQRARGMSFRAIAETPGWDVHSQAILRFGVAFRRARVRRVDLLVCQAGVGAQGQAFLDLLHRFWGTTVRAMRGTAAYAADGRYWVYRPIAPRPGALNTGYRNGATIATNDPDYRGSRRFMEGAIPGYPHDSMFTTSRGGRLF